MNKHLWGFWDMLKAYAAEFVELVLIMEDVRREFEEAIEHGTVNNPLPQQKFQKMLDQGKRLAEMSNEISLPVTEALADRIIKLGEFGEPVDVIAGAQREFLHTLKAELQSHRFFYVPPSRANYYDHRSDAIIATKISAKAAEDLDEASKCIALGRYTSSIFHLMRAMERAVTVLAQKLGATVENKHGQYLSWQVLAANVKGKIDNLDKGSTKTAWYDVLAMLHSVGDAWRNTTMHPKQTYTEEEAREIIAATRGFMRRLAALA